MGLAASQARYLTLTSRKSDLEFQSQTINSRRIQLSYKTAEIARAYSEGMNNKVIKINIPKPNTDGTTTDSWSELTFANLLSEGYMIIGTGGTELYPNPYEQGEVTTEYYNVLADKANVEISKEDYKLLPATDQAAYTTTTLVNDEDNKAAVKYVLKGELTKSVYDKLSVSVKALYNSTPDERTSIEWGVNPDYNNAKNARDLQSLLVSGKAQIVPKAFFNFLVETGAYSYSSGLTGPYSYKELLDRWKSNSQNDNPDGLDSVIDWRADETSTFAQKTYTEDDADVLAKYEAETAEVQAQDKILEMEEKNIETQHKAIETELENVKKVIQKNIEETFKIFS